MDELTEKKGKLTRVAVTGGLQLDNKGLWYNPTIEKKKEILIILDDLRKRINKNVIISLNKAGEYVNVIIDKEKEENQENILTENIKEENIGCDKVVNIKGKDFVTYAGLLEQAHKEGLKGFEILEHWESHDMKMAWCKVRATFIDKNNVISQFDGIGSSTPDNTGSMTQDHPIEMANTRAKGRALRDYLNIGQAMIEEIKQGQ